MYYSLCSGLQPYFMSCKVTRGKLLKTYLHTKIQRWENRDRKELLFTTIHYYSLLFTTIHYYSLLFTTIHYYSLLLTSIHYYSLSKLLLLVIWWRYSESSYLLVEWFVEVALHEVLGFSLLNSAVSHYSTCTSTGSHISSWFFPPLSTASEFFSYRRLINV
jgi:hypothetical protein